MVIVVFVRRHGQDLGLGRVDGLAPELEVPINEFAMMLVDFGVLDYDGPGTDAGFTPALQLVSSRLEPCG